MVQNHHVIHTNKKKRNILPRSKLLVQLSSLRENNRLLAKAVADKTLKICELENTELSYENLKQESREFIKSFHEYVMKVETRLRNAASELTGVVSRISGILSMTNEEKETVDSLWTLVEESKYSSSPPSSYTLRDRTFSSTEMHSKCSESKKSRSQKTIKRVHPMNLKKTVCILEPVEERNDTICETVLTEENECIGGKQPKSMNKVKNERKAQNKTIHRQHRNEIDSELLNPLYHSQFTKVLSDTVPLKQVPTVVKQELISPKNDDDDDDYDDDESAELRALQIPLKECTWSQSSTCISLSPRRLRERKPINYSLSSMSNCRYQSSGTKYSRTRTITNTLTDKENIAKFRAESTQEKSTNRGNRKQVSKIPLSKQEIKVEPICLNSSSEVLGTQCTGADTTVDGTQEVSSRICDRLRTNRKQYSRKSVKLSDGFSSRCGYLASPEDRRIDNISSSVEPRMCHRMKHYGESFREEDCDRKYLTNLSQRDGEDSLLGVKQEIVSPQNVSIGDTFLSSTFEDMLMNTTTYEL